MKFVKILICDCGGDFILKNNSINCIKCGAIKKRNNNTIIFEEVYKPTNSKPQIYNFSDKVINSSKSWRVQNYKLTKDWAEELTSIEYVIDLGCGPLTNSNLLKDFNTIFIDGGKFDNIDVVCDFAKKLPIKSESVEAILCSNVFEHLSEPEICMKEISRVLKKNGKALILIPFIIKLHQEPFDFYRYTKHALKYISKKSNLDVQEIKEIGGVSEILSTLFRIYIASSNNYLFKLSLKMQYIILRISRKIFKDDKPISILPQGYALYLKKTK